MDGLPLAIELATARLRLFTPEELLDRLSSRLELLRGGARDLPERQQTIRATIEWSYELLEPAEQRLFEVFSVFSTAGYEAVENVVTALRTTSGMDVDALEGLGSLLDKNLVRHVPAGAAQRVGMLETIREYAAERLRLNPPFEDAARRAHAIYFAALAAASDDAAPAADEIENLRAAWRYWVGQRDLEQLNSMTEGLWHAHEALGLYHATVEQLTELLDVLASSPDSPETSARRIELQIRRLRAIIFVEGYTSDVEEIAVQTLEGFEALRTGVAELYPVLRMLAGLYEFRTEFAKARDIAGKILDLADERNDGDMRAAGHLLLAASASFTGNLRGAAERFDEALAWYTAHPPSPRALLWGVHSAVAAHNASALNLWLLGFPDRAAERALGGIELAERLGHPHSVAYANYHTGFLYLWRQEPDLVMRYARGVFDAMRDQEIAIWRALGQCLVGAANVGLGAAEEGIAQLDSAIETYQGLRTPPVFWPFLRLMQATAYAQTGRNAPALSIIDEAMATPGYGSFPQFNLVRGALLLAMSNGGPVDTAAACFESAYQTSAAMGSRMTQLQAVVALRRLGVARGTEDGLAALRSTYDSFTEGFATPDLVAARELLGS